MDSNPATLLGRVERLDCSSHGRPRQKGLTQDGVANTPKILMWIEHAYLLRFPSFRRD